MTDQRIAEFREKFSEKNGDRDNYYVDGDVRIPDIESWLTTTLAEVRKETIEDCMKVISKDEPRMIGEYYNQIGMARNELRDELRLALDQMKKSL